MEGNGYNDANSIIEVLPVHSDIECTYICSNRDRCYVAEFDRNNKQCSLIAKSFSGPESGLYMYPAKDKGLFIVLH